MKEYDVEVEWQAFELHPEFPPEGIVRDGEVSPQRKASGEYLKQLAAEVNLPLVDRKHIPNSRLSLEAAEYARSQGKFDDFHRALLHAYFGEGRNIGDKLVLAEVAREVGLDAGELRQALDDRTYRDEVQEQVDTAHHLGITAVPTFVIGNRALVGCQPYETFKLVMASLEDH